jgi:hypothetical protein
MKAINHRHGDGGKKGKVLVHEPVSLNQFCIPVRARRQEKYL